MLLAFTGGNATTFRAVTNTYSTGSGNEVVPSGATQVVITADGGGTGGGRSSALALQDALGGRGGARCVLTKAVLSGEWGTNLAYAVGAGGAVATVRGNNGTAGEASTVTGTLNGGAVNVTTSTGGTSPSGGDTNTAGTAGTVGDGVTNGNGGAGAGGGAGYVPGAADTAGGGGSVAAAASGTGATGRIVFAWT